MDLIKIRRDFPILKKGIIYLDNAASSLTPDQVLDKMMEYYHNYRANIHRGVHQLSQNEFDPLAIPPGFVRESLANNSVRSFLPVC